MDRGEVELEEARQTRVRRASILTTNKERNEYELCVQCCATGAIRARKGRAKHSHGCPTSESSGLSAVRDCRVSSRSMNESSPTVLVLLRRFMERNEIVRWFAKPQSLMRSIVCGHVLGACQRKQRICRPGARR